LTDDGHIEITGRDLRDRAFCASAGLNSTAAA
jgi:hypothetical protein